MQVTTLPMGASINESLQIGDTVYYASTSTSGGFSTVDYNNIVEFGIVVSIGANSIDVVYDEMNVAVPTIVPTPDFIMFSKNNQVNSSSLKGYYAEIEFKNYRTDKIELFSIGAEVSESSK